MQITTPPTDTTTETNPTESQPTIWTKAAPWLGGYSISEMIDAGFIQDVIMVLLRSIF